MTELESCPFCGSININLELYAPENKSCIRCEDCWSILKFYDTTEEAIKAWNRREKMKNDRRR